MFSKSAFVFAFLAVANLAVATPPACLLAAINTQETLSDYEAICKNASDVQSSIQSLCASANVDAALTAFASACKEKGVTVPTPSSIVSSATATASSKSASSTKVATTVASTATGSAAASGHASSGLATATTTGSSSATATVATSTGAAGRIEGNVVGGLFALGAGVWAVL